MSQTELIGCVSISLQVFRCCCDTWKCPMWFLSM